MLEERAIELYSEATNVKFTDAGQDSSVIITEITKVHFKFKQNKKLYVMKI